MISNIRYLALLLFCMGMPQMGDAQEDGAEFSPGAWAVVLPLPAGSPTYLESPEISSAEHFQIEMSQGVHVANINALRAWRSSTGKQAHSYVDYVLSDSTTRNYVQFAASGYALEGMAIVSLIETFEGNITSLRSYGFWTETPLQGALASLGPEAQLQITEADWFSVEHDGTIFYPSQKQLVGSTKADPKGLEQYRKHLKRWWGQLPSKTARELTEGSGALRKTIRIDEQLARQLAETLETNVPTLVDLDEHLESADYSSSESSGIVAFGEIWSPLFESVCAKMPMLDCLPFVHINTRFPQSAIEWGIDIGIGHPTFQYMVSGEPWSIEYVSNSNLLLAIHPEDVLVEEKTDQTGMQSVVVDFAPSRTAFINGQMQFLSRYVGEVDNELAHGLGTLYFIGSDPEINWEVPNRRSLTGTFVSGQLTGVATFYYSDGLPECTGTWKGSLKDGEVRCNRPGGSPSLRATYLQGKMVDGPVTKVELNSHTLIPHRIFDGRLESGKLVGEWQFIPFGRDYTDGSSLLVVGNQAVYIWPNQESFLSGEFDHKRSTFVGPCTAKFPTGVLETTCNGAANPSFPFDGAGRFTPSDTNTDQITQDVHVTNGAWDFTVIEMVWHEETNFIKKIGSQIGQWGKDFEGFGRDVRDWFCETMDSLAPEKQECNINVAVHVSDDGNVTIGDTAGSRPSSGSEARISDEALAWLRNNEIQDMLTLPNRFEEEPYFGLAKYSVGGPADLMAPAFPEGHVSPPTISGQLRNSVRGFPEFGARRSRKNQKYVFHTGIDYATFPGQEIVSPVSGTVSRLVRNPDGLNTIVIKTDSVAIRILYVNDTVPVGTRVTQGQRVARAGNLSVRRQYHGVPNHVHMTILDRNEVGNTYDLTGLKKIPLGWPYPFKFEAK